MLRKAGGGRARRHAEVEDQQVAGGGDGDAGEPGDSDPVVVGHQCKRSRSSRDELIRLVIISMEKRGDGKQPFSVTDRFAGFRSIDRPSCCI